jgi:hypothetical protein
MTTPIDILIVDSRPESLLTLKHLSAAHGKNPTH